MGGLHGVVLVAEDVHLSATVAAFAVEHKFGRALDGAEAAVRVHVPDALWGTAVWHAVAAVLAELGVGGAVIGLDIVDVGIGEHDPVVDEPDARRLHEIRVFGDDRACRRLLVDGSWNHVVEVVRVHAVCEAELLEV